MRDRFGLTVTTSSHVALEAYDRAVHGILGWDGDALGLFRAALTADSGLALAHAGSAVCLFLEERFAEARAAAEAARAALDGASPRERSHVDAMTTLVTGRPPEAERRIREHLGAFPRDLAVVQRLYFLFFWQGRFPEMLELTQTLVREDDGTSFPLGLHAFALEQDGRCDEAVRVADAALTRNPGDAWAVHALAHALYEQAAWDTGLTRVPAAIAPCTHLGWFRNHLRWHVALLHLSRGEYEQASTLSRTVFEEAPSAIAGELHDSISLLWRLELVGLPVGARWKPFAAIARERLNRQGLLFHAVHLAMALAAGGDWATAERQQALLRERTAKDPTGLIASLALPLIEGLHAFVARDYALAVARIEPLGPRIVALGGSRAQRDVFHDTLLEACFRAGNAERAQRLLAARVARRPDHVWAARAAR